MPRFTTARTPLFSTSSVSMPVLNRILGVVLILLVVALVVCGVIRMATPQTHMSYTSSLITHHNPFTESAASQTVMDILHTHTSVRCVDGRARATLSPLSPLSASSAPPHLLLYVNRPRMFDRIMASGELGMCESYMDGDWDTPHLEPLLTELTSRSNDMEHALKAHSVRLVGLYLRSKLVSAFVNRNSHDRSSDNIISHYDVGNDLYTKMLGPTMQYTCAYYAHPGITSLDDAQRTKMSLIAHKLDLRQGMTVLDIGCGFGAMAHYLADAHGVHVVGVTLSPSQVELARDRFAHPNVDIRLQDYREVDGTYDRVYSIGMFEHVGHENYDTYLDTCHRLLAPDGVMLLHTIATRDRNWEHVSFINTYIFPGGELPCLHHIAERQSYDKWHLEDLHNFGLSYAKTLRAWRANIGDWEGLCPRKYPTRFRRMWDVYLQGCAAAFQLRNIMLWQLVFTKRGERRGMDDMGARIRGFVVL